MVPFFLKKGPLKSPLGDPEGSPRKVHTLIQSANENDDADDSINPVDAEPAKLVLGGQVDVLSTHHHDEQAELVLRGQVDVPLSSCLPDMTPVPLPPVSIPDIPLLVHDVQDHHVPAVVRQL